MACRDKCTFIKLRRAASIFKTGAVLRMYWRGSQMGSVLLLSCPDGQPAAGYRVLQNYVYKSVIKLWR